MGKFSSISDLIYSHGERRPNKPAFIEGNIIVTWKEFNEQINCIAHHVKQHSKGERSNIGILSGGGIWTYAIFFGILRSGNVAVPFSTTLSTETLKHLICDSQIAILYSSSEMLDQAQRISKSLTEIQFFEQSKCEESISKCSSVYPKIEIGIGSPCSIIYSSGTTGNPKGVVHTNLSRLWFAAELSEKFGISSDSTILVTTPAYSNGTNICMLPAIYQGACSILLNPFDIGELFDIVKFHKPSHTFMVPTQYQALVTCAETRVVDWSCFHTMVTAGAPMCPELRGSVTNLIGPKLAELWGLTEGVGTIMTSAEMVLRPGSVGRVSGGADIRIIDSSRGCITGGVGEIVGRSMMVMEGYWNRVGVTEELYWIDNSGVAYLKTGDLGEIDDDGYLWIRGRIKDMIISGGFNVYPVDIEAVLSKHPDISEVCVFAQKHKKWGEVPVGVYIPVSNTAVSSVEILEWANTVLSKTQRLLSLEIYTESEFPRNALGKIMKNQLVSEKNTESGHEKD